MKTSTKTQTVEKPNHFKIAKDFYDENKKFGMTWAEAKNHPTVAERIITANFNYENQIGA